MRVLLILALFATAYAAPLNLEVLPEDEDMLEHQDLGPGFWGGDMAGISSEGEAVDAWNAITDKSRKWSGGVIPYTLASNFPSSERSQITSAISAFNSKARCLRIVPRTNQANYVQVVRESGCWSFVGCLRRGAQKLSLGPGCTRTGTIQHEFLHAAGFYHEHQRSDRDSYVRIDFANIRRGTENNFRLQRSDLLGSPYDYGSVMHYGRTAFSTNGRPTIVPTRDPNARIGQRVGPSRADLDRISKLYC